MFYGLLYFLYRLLFLYPLTVVECYFFFVMKSKHHFFRQPLYCGQKKLQQSVIGQVAVHWLGIEQCAGGCLPLIWAQKLAILTGSSLWFCSVTS